MADAPDFQVYLPIDPSVPLLISLQAALHIYEKTPEYGEMQVIMKGEAAEGENILELEIADAQNVDEKGAPNPIWDFIIVLRYGIPSRHKITNGPNRGQPPFSPLRSLQRRPQAPQLKSKFLAKSQKPSSQFLTIRGALPKQNDFVNHFTEFGLGYGELVRNDYTLFVDAFRNHLFKGI